MSDVQAAMRRAAVEAEKAARPLVEYLDDAELKLSLRRQVLICTERLYNTAERLRVLADKAVL